MPATAAPKPVLHAFVNDTAYERDHADLLRLAAKHPVRVHNCYRYHVEPTYLVVVDDMVVYRTPRIEELL